MTARGAYVLPAVVSIALLMVGLVVSYCGGVGSIPYLLLMFAGALLLWLPLFARIVRPPTLVIAADGLTRLDGLLRRHWRWDQIVTFEFDRATSSFVRFAYQRAPDGPVRGTIVWMPTYVDRNGIYDPKGLCDRLRAALMAARAAGASRPNVVLNEANAATKTRLIVHASIVGWAVLLICGAIFIDQMAARTEMLSPVPVGARAVCSGAGALFGIPCVYLVVRWHRTHAIPLRRFDAFVHLFLSGVVVGMIGFFAGLHVAARIAEARSFVGQPVMTRRISAPIVDWTAGKGGAFAYIAPYVKGRRIKLPIPSEDHDRLLQAGRRNGASPYCYRLTIETAGEGIRLVWPPGVRRMEKQRIVPCAA